MRLNKDEQAKALSLVPAFQRLVKEILGIEYGEEHAETVIACVLLAEKEARQ